MSSNHVQHSLTYVHARAQPTFQAGLVKNIIESWYPADMGEYVLFAEDDIELSKHWYAWVKDAVFRYASAPVCRVWVR